MSCRKTICQECSTTWDDIHYCVSCLAQQRRSRKTGATHLRWLVWVLGFPFLFYLVSWALVWSTLFVTALLTD